jgi:hypothetical protein
MIVALAGFHRSPGFFSAVCGERAALLIDLMKLARIVAANVPLVAAGVD